MKKSMISIILLSSLSTYAQAEYLGSSAKNVWEVVNSNPYVKLPESNITFKSLVDGTISLIQRSANRTLNDQSDLLPYFTKLAHPNGACLKGTWEITEANEYSGLFKKGSKAIIISRASVALNDTETGDLRGFGLAGKLFPTTNENEVVKTANFFLIDDLGGTKAAHYTDVEMTNEPKLSKTMAVFKNLRYIIKVATTFKKEDSNPLKRQVYEIANANLDQNEKESVPKLMMVKANTTHKVDARDFRDEFNMNDYNGNLNFDIYVSKSDKKKARDLKKIGHISFTESVVSEACDHNLHFHHPKWRSELE